jgi:hypothetical protein
MMLVGEVVGLSEGEVEMEVVAWMGEVGVVRQLMLGIEGGGRTWSAPAMIRGLALVGGSAVKALQLEEHYAEVAGAAAWEQGTAIGEAADIAQKVVSDVDMAVEGAARSYVASVDQEEADCTPASPEVQGQTAIRPEVVEIASI